MWGCRGLQVCPLHSLLLLLLLLPTAPATRRLCCPPHTDTRRAAPELSVPREYGSEQKRVVFLNALGSQLYAQTRIRLHLRRLYRAGGSAIHELRRLAASLRQAAAASSSSSSPSAAGHAAASLAEAQLQEGAQAARELSQSIGASGAALVAALAAAPGAAAAVASTLAATADLPALRRELQAALGAARQQAAQLEKAVAVLGQEQAVLEGELCAPGVAATLIGGSIWTEPSAMVAQAEAAHQQPTSARLFPCHLPCTTHCISSQPPAWLPGCLAAWLPGCLPSGRIERRHLELDRAERRLDSLQAVKPAHAAEAEGLERELGGLYSLYLHKWVGGAESAEATGELRA